MKRRDFVRNCTIAATAILLPERHATAEAKGSALKAFIVADAHLGWESEQQPSADEQREMMRRIRRRFPDRDEPLGQWTDVIPAECGPIPFYYVPGNHEASADNPRYEGGRLVLSVNKPGAVLIEF